MGRIKSLLVKRTAKQLLIKQPDVYTESFETDKRILGRSMPSKSVRNKIAGYLARLQRMKRDENKRQEKIKIKLEQAQAKEEQLQADIY